MLKILKRWFGVKPKKTAKNTIADVFWKIGLPQQTPYFFATGAPAPVLRQVDTGKVIIGLESRLVLTRWDFIGVSYELKLKVPHSQVPYFANWLAEIQSSFHTVGQTYKRVFESLPHQLTLEDAFPVAIEYVNYDYADVVLSCCPLI